MRRGLEMFEQPYEVRFVDAFERFLRIADRISTCLHLYVPFIVIAALGRRVESAEHAASNTGDLRRLDTAIREEQQQREKALHILKEIMDAKDSAKDRAASLR